MMRGFWRALALMVAAGVSSTAHAHEFIAKPGAMTVPAGAELQVAGLSSHIFLISQELEAPKDVKVGFYADGSARIRVVSTAIGDAFHSQRRVLKEGCPGETAVFGSAESED